MVFVEINAVMDDVDLRGVDLKEFQDIVLRLTGDGHDGVGHLDRGLFHPRAEVVTARQLFALPGPQRFERMGGDDERYAVIKLSQDATQMRVPGVDVDDICVDIGRVKVETALDCAECVLERIGAGVFLSSSG